MNCFSNTTLSRRKGRGTSAAGGWYRMLLIGLLLAVALFAAPVAAADYISFSAEPTSGYVPLTVQFTDTSVAEDTSDFWWDFGDGTGSSDRNPVHIYTKKGTYTVRFGWYNPGGGEDITITDYITVLGATTPPVADFTATPMSGDAPLKVQFTDLSGNYPGEWSWDFDNDGIADSIEKNPSFTYANPGTYSVSLTVSNDAGSDSRTETDFITALIPVVPDAGFSANITSGDIPLTVAFTDESAYNATSWAWDFDNDGTVDSTVRNPVYLYTRTGTFTVKLAVANAAGSDEETRTDYITVNAVPAPIADFSVTPTTGYNPLAVAFTDTSTGSVTSWAWDFNNDGTVDSTKQNPSYTYPSAGSFSVNLSVTGWGGSDSIVKTGYITVLQTIGPVWSAISGWNVPDIGSYSAPVFADLDNDGDYDLLIGESSGVTYGYENTGTTVSPVWTAKTTWNAPDIGSRSVPAAADLDNDGDYDLLIGESSGITYGYENTGTMASPVWTAKSAWNVPDVGIYAAPALADLDGDSDNDLLIGESSGVTYGYENTGTIASPVWTAKSAWNVPDVGSYAAPVFADLDNDGDYDLLIGESSGVSYEYENTGTTVSPVWTAKSSWNAPDIGTYAVPAAADLDNDGDNDLIIGAYSGISYGYRNTGFVPSLAPPVAAFTASPLSGYSPETVQFIDTSENKPRSWSWDFGDGSTSTVKNPSHVYENPGIYTVTLTVTNSLGSDTIIKDRLITIEAPIPLVAGFTATPVSGTAPLTVQFSDTSTGSITAYSWDFNNDGVVDSSAKDPSYTYNAAGVYSVNHTVSGYGLSSSSVQTDLITATGISDLVVMSSPAFTAYYQNTVKATVTNAGSADTGAFKVRLEIDGNTTTADVASVAAYGSTTVSIIDPVWGRKYGDVVPVTITVDPENVIAETNEANNEYATTVTVQTNSDAWYGGRYYKGIDLETTYNAEGHIGMAISNGGTAYGGGNPTYTAEELGIPADAIIKAARLYLAWTWYGYTPYTVSFNGHSVAAPLAHYEDPNDGQDVYDVTEYFVPGATNTATIGGGCSASYGRTLVVVYESPSQPYRKISLNEGYDVIYRSEGYAMFRDVDTTAMSSAQVITVTPSGGGEDSGSIGFNGQNVNIASGGGSDPAFNYYDVTGAIQDGTNELESYRASYYSLSNAILIVTKASAVTADFTADTIAGTAPLTVTFTDASTGSPTSWSWDFGDGNTENATVQNPVHTYANPRTYTVKLTAGNDLGSDTWTRTNYITVTAPVVIPVAAFSATPASGMAPLTVVFTDESTNTPASWLWDFGDNDNTNATKQNPVHTYANEGTYTVKLTATNSAGSGIEEKAGLITVTETIIAPVAAFTATPTTGDAPLAVTFTDKSTNGPTEWLWDFGDGGTSADQNPVHTYATPGMYTVKLTATNSAGSGDATRTGYIIVATPSTNGAVVISGNVVQHIAPVADFTADKTSGTAPLTVQFTDTSTNSPTSWSWDFGDSSTSTDKNPSHLYTAEGTYTVILEATNDYGTDSITKTNLITVSAAPVAPVADFSADKTFGDYPLTVQFTDESTGTVDTWSWDFNGDGTEDSAAQNPSMQYLARGTYTVRLTVTGAGTSDTETKTGYIVVTELAPAVDFTADQTSGTSPLTVVFTGSNTGGEVNSWAWDFGDGTTGSGQTVSHTYTSATAKTYTVTLTATGPDHTDTETKTGYISVGAQSIDVRLSSGSIDFGTMAAGTDETGSTTVTVDVSGGTAWSVTATANNGGYMSTGTATLASPFQLSNGGSFQDMTTGFADFLTGTAGSGSSGTASVKQAIAYADAPGDYSITLTFTGAFD